MKKKSIISRIMENGTLCRAAERKSMLISMIMLCILVFIAIAAPVLSPHDPNEIDLKSKNLPPSSNHLLGTDYLGRDMLSRIMHGATTSLSIATGVVVLSLIIGISMGCIAGYYGGIVDEIFSRAIDIFLAFPGIIFALAMMGVLGPGIMNLMLSLALVHWSTYARLMRGQVLSIKEQEYVLSTRLLGASNIHTMRKHIIPNAIAPIIVLATIDFGHVILSVAALSFLGLGLPMDIPEWGSMLSAGKEFMRTAPYQTIFPGLTITLFVVIFSVLGDGMRDILDPHDHGGDLY
ncbi:ABC transporter permease [Methanomethylovorans sp.]|uniref:ABC transporter permease n=1 Tax=Methanomethylovorans sp. TaxID=2758717 RepID=UPI00345E0A79